MLILFTIKCFTQERAWFTKRWRHKICTLLSIGLLATPVISLANTIADELPSSLPTSLPVSNAEINTNLKTPEYVIFEPNDQATFSSETAASVLSVPVKEGNSFHAGDILLQLDCRVQVADLNKSKAQMQAANIAKTSADKLKSYGSISEFELTKAKSDLDMSKAEVDKLTAIVDKCVIKAPFNGSVAELMVHTNETVKPGDPLLKIVNTENLELKLQVPSLWLRWLHVGSSFIVHVNETNKKVTAYVTKINPEIDSISQTVKIFGALKQQDPDLRPGMSGQAVFPDNPSEKQDKSTH